MRPILIILTLLVCSACSDKTTAEPVPANVPQKHMLEGSIRGYPNNPVLLLGFHGYQSAVIDSAMTSPTGAFSINLPASLQPGIYRLVLVAAQDKMMYLDFVYNREKIKFSTSYEALLDSLKILSSKENKGFYEFLRRQSLYEQKLSVLNQAILNYPEKDNFYRRLSRQIRKMRNKHSNYTENLIKKNEKLIFSRIISIQQTPRIDDKLPEKEIFNFTRDNFFCNTDFSDTLLLSTPYITEKILRYISLFRDHRLQEEEQEERYIQAVDTIMKKASVNEALYFVLAEYMVNGFESLQMNAVSEYIISQYILGGPCDRTDMPEGLRNKAEDIKRFLPGMKAPDFEFRSMDGKPGRLFDLDKNFILLVFWSTSCPHCTDLMPRLKSLYDQVAASRPEYFEIVAVGIEKEKTDWESYIRSENLSFLNTTELKGWDSEIAMLYNINATPMLFLLDRDKKIVLKPDRFRQLERFLRQAMN